MNRKWTIKELRNIFYQCEAREENEDYARIANRLKNAIEKGKCVRFSLYEKDLIINALYGDNSETTEYKAFERKLYGKGN